MEDSTERAFEPLLTTTDWNAEWQELQKFRRHRDDAAFWDKRSATFATKDAPNPYVERFLELAGLRPGETVFDMGCGTGSLAIPTALRGHQVVAADFSQGMLDQLREGMEENGVTSIRPVLMSWEDDWPAHGVDAGFADVCFASRSIAVEDLRAALLKLNAVARRRVCVTLPTGASPRSDARILREVGIDELPGYDYLYAFNILAEAGITPEVAYIQSPRKDTFDTLDEAYDKFVEMVDAPRLGVTESQRAQARVRLRAWLREHAVENPDVGKPDKKGLPQRALCLDRPRVFSWAFVSWDKRR